MEIRVYSCKHCEAMPYLKWALHKEEEKLACQFTCSNQKCKIHKPKKFSSYDISKGLSEETMILIIYGALTEWNYENIEQHLGITDVPIALLFEETLKRFKEF